MTQSVAPRELVVGCDGSPGVAVAIEIAARLLPARRARIVHLWAPPFTSSELRARLARRARSVDELVALLEREGRETAERVAAQGAALAIAAGWDAAPAAHRAYGGEGLELALAPHGVTESGRAVGDALADVADEDGAAVIAVGSRGRSAAREILLGSVAMAVLHHAARPVLVVPCDRRQD